ncbi:MAG: molybdopterin-dependent oxidoreductase [Thermaerobacter sp.]|nr:molybdopterin-dependent oxidoreductase [Thermaerobacter sp.]
MSGTTAVFGRNASMQTPEVWSRHTELVLMWGCNASAAGIHQEIGYLYDAMERGARLIVVDPIVTAVASKAHLHLRPRPSTDAALALGMINHIVSRNLHDQDYLERHTQGFSQLMEEAGQWTLERTREVTGVPEGLIAQAAEEYATHRSLLECGYGHQRYTNGHRTQQAISALAAVCGHMGQPGAHCNFMEVGAAYTGFLNSARVQNPPGADIKKTRLISISHFGPALRTAQDPPIKGIIKWRGSLITQQPDARGMIEAVKGLDFLVSIDQFLTDDTDWSDLVLPACTIFEQWGVHPSYRHQYLQLQVPVLEPQHESMPDIDFWAELARRMGYEAYFPREWTGLDWLRLLLPDDFPLEQAMHPHGPVRLPERFCPPVPNWDGNFQTPSGKIELYSGVYAERAQRFPGEWDPVPRYVPSAESPDGDPERAARYPLLVVSQHPATRTHSQFGNLPYIQEIEGPATAMLHPDDAAARGIAEHDRIRIYNDRADSHVLAHLTRKVLPGTVELDSGRWIKTGGNVNLLIHPRAAGPRDVGDGVMAEYDMQLDGHTIPYFNLLVEVEKA